MTAGTLLRLKLPADMLLHTVVMFHAGAASPDATYSNKLRPYSSCWMQHRSGKQVQMPLPRAQPEAACASLLITLSVNCSM